VLRTDPKRPDLRQGLKALRALSLVHGHESFAGLGFLDIIATVLLVERWR
jgi:hypothetical protein